MKIQPRNLVRAVCDQLSRKGALRNIFVTRNAFGIFSRYSHIARGSGKPKMSYPSRKVALRAADAMGGKYGVHFSVYKCAWCDGWHVGKNAQNKVRPEPEDGTRNPAPADMPNSFYKALGQYAAGLAPVFDRGLCGPARRCTEEFLGRLRASGIGLVIDLRPAGGTARLAGGAERAGLEYRNIPLDGRNTDFRQIIRALPELFGLMDKGGFYIADDAGRSRTDTALAMYYVLHPSVPFAHVPELVGHRSAEKKRFRCDDIAAGVNKVIRSATPEESAALGLPSGYETEFNRRKKRLFEANRNFENTGTGDKTETGPADASPEA